jgi:hypothetical protein
MSHPLMSNYAVRAVPQFNIGEIALIQDHRIFVGRGQQMTPGLMPVQT